MTDVRDALLQQIKDKAVVHGKVTLSSGKEADYYVDLRRITLDAQAAPLVGQVMLEVTAGLDYDAVGGWTPSWFARRARHTDCSVGSKDRTSRAAECWQWRTPRPLAALCWLPSRRCARQVRRSSASR